MKQSLIFLHGGPGFRDYLEPYFRQLNDSFDCHFYDQLRGPTIIIEDLILQLLGEVERFSKPVLIGHSWGGTLATEFALRYQEKLNGLVTMCSLLSSQQWLEYHKELRELNLEGAKPEQIFLVPSDSDAGRKFLDQTWSTFSEDTFDSLNNTYIKNFDVTGDLGQITLKFLNIFGEKDLRVPSRVTRGFRVFNSSIIDHQIKGAGHFPFLQEPNRTGIHQILRDSFS